MKKLEEIGFEEAGQWLLIDDSSIQLDIQKHINTSNVLYAFVCGEELLYIGKTVRPLLKRLQVYEKPGPTQATNIRSKASIIKILKRGESVEIYVFADKNANHYNGVKINMAAALEDDLISRYLPKWNRAGKKIKKIKKKAEITSSLEDLPPAKFKKSKQVNIVAREFKLILRPTYYKSGFFNVPVSNENMFADDGAKIIINCNNEIKFEGKINRSCNRSGAPRIMGGVKLRDWIQSYFQAGDEILINIISPGEILITEAT